VDTASLPAGVDGIMGLWYYAKGNVEARALRLDRRDAKDTFC